MRQRSRPHIVGFFRDIRIINYPQYSSRTINDTFSRRIKSSFLHRSRLPDEEAPCASFSRRFIWHVADNHICESVYRSIDPRSAQCALILLIFYHDKLCVAVVNNYYRLVCLRYIRIENAGNFCPASIISEL